VPKNFFLRKWIKKYNSLEECESNGWVMVRGGFVDRIGRDGEFPELKEDVNIFKFEMSGFNKNEENMDTISLEKYINKVQDDKRQISDKLLNVE
jgi:hypothetical protein